MRVGIVGLLQESNTFIRQRTTLEHFRDDLLLLGHPIVVRLADAHHEVGGFLAGLAEQRMEAVPLLFARALPHGPLQSSAFHYLLERMEEQVRGAGQLDGVLAAAHGATVCESHPDADGFWLTALRRWIGPRLPLVCTIDPHANLSPAMIAACDATLAYQTNPHVDQRQTGHAAARLIGRCVRGEIRPTQAAAYPPMVMNIERQNTGEEPCRSLMDAARQVTRRPGVLAASVCLGFPYADVPEMGSSAVVVTDDAPRQAVQYAEQLAMQMWSRRDAFIGNLHDVDDAVEVARQAVPPVCLLDMGDNVGGGSPADGTLLAHALYQRQLGPSFVSLCDPQSVQQVCGRPPGSEVELSMGGKSDVRHGAPLHCRVRLVGVYDGVFQETEARHGGFCRFDQGETAIVQTVDGGLTIMLTSRRMVPFSLAQLTSCRLDPAAFRYLVVKGVQAPLAAYRAVCATLVHVNTPGVTCADIEGLQYRHRRRPLFPFERDARWGGTCRGQEGQLE